MHYNSILQQLFNFPTRHRLDKSEKSLLSQILRWDILLDGKRLFPFIFEKSPLPSIWKERRKKLSEISDDKAPVRIDSRKVFVTKIGTITQNPIFDSRANRF